MFALPSLLPRKWYPMMPLFYQANSTLLAQTLSAPPIRPSSKPSTPILASAMSQLRLILPDRFPFPPLLFISLCHSVSLWFPAQHLSNSQPSLPVNTPKQRWRPAPSFPMAPCDVSSAGDDRNQSSSAWGETSSQPERRIPSPHAPTRLDAAVGGQAKLNNHIIKQLVTKMCSNSCLMWWWV